MSGDTNSVFDVFLRDVQAGTTARVSVASGGTQADGGSQQAALSPDGRYLAFESAASNLVVGDSNGQSDIFVRDLQAGYTRRASVSTDGSETNGNNHYPSLSADGGVVAFESAATNTVAGDTNGVTDTFVRVEPPVQVSTYTYDKLSRLLSVSAPEGSYAYGYDPAGNRTSKSLGTITAYTYDRADRMLTAGAASVTVNANGNLTAKGSDSYSYDQANRLTTSTVSGVTTSYAYDGDGLRFSSQVSGSPVQRWVSDTNGALARVVDDGARKYVHGMGLAYSIAGSTLEVYHVDRLGSVRLLTDGTGAVTATYRSDPWGSTISTTGSSSQPFGYTGEPGGSGLTYLRARYYSADLGRFLTRDRWLGVPSAPQTLNRHAYVANNPVNLTDPSGQAIDTVLDVGFIIYDLASLLFGPPKDREGNLLALGADVAGAGIPFATGLGIVARAGAKAGKIRLLVDDLVHIAERHLPGGARVAGKSVFYDVNDLMGLIRKAEGVVPYVQANTNLARVVDAGREIGVDQAGFATSIYTVITRADGTVVNMFPGLP